MSLSATPLLALFAGIALAAGLVNQVTPATEILATADGRPAFVFSSLNIAPTSAPLQGARQ